VGATSTDHDLYVKGLSKRLLVHQAMLVFSVLTLRLLV
jgi:hypothetical protein